MTATPLQLLCYDRTFRITPKLTIEMIESLNVTLALFAKPEKPQVSPRPAARLIKKGPFPIALGIPKPGVRPATNAPGAGVRLADVTVYPIFFLAGRYYRTKGDPGQKHA